MLKQIIDLLLAIPAVVSSIRELIGWIRSITSEKPADVAKEVRDVFKTAKQAKTKADRTAAARRIADRISRG